MQRILGWLAGDPVHTHGWRGFVAVLVAGSVTGLGIGGLLLFGLGLLRVFIAS